MIRGLLPNSVIIVLLSMILSSCGGASGGTASTGNDSTGDTTINPTVTLRLVRVVDNVETAVTTVDPSRDATVIAAVANVDEDVVVNFSTTIGQFNPTTGTSLTEDGEASIVLQAGTTAGAGTLTASIVVDGVTFQSNGVAFQVLEFDEVEDELSLGTCSGDPLDCTGSTFTAGGMEITLDLVAGEPIDGIASQGTAEIGFVVVRNADPTDPVVGQNVTISSRCSALGLASISQPSSGAGGVVTASYQAEEGCEDSDAITATIANTSASASGSIFVYEPRIGSINFDSVQNSSGATIENIFVKESGGESLARVIFQVVDEHGNPKPDVDVTFELSTVIGGLSLQNQTRKTNDAGQAIAFVNAGFIPTTVVVTATVEVDTDNNTATDPVERSAASSSLAVNTGIAHQGAFSISTQVSNLEGEQFDNIETILTVNLADQSSNPVPDGTAVSFRTEYGRITPSCTTVDGNCEVTWNSQEPRRPQDVNTLVPDMNEGTGACPNPLIKDEEVTVAGTDADTDFITDEVFRVETSNLPLVLTTDYTFTATESEFECAGGSVECVVGAILEVDYDFGGAANAVEHVLLVDIGGTATGFLANAIVDIDGITTVNKGLVEGDDYTVDDDGTGITCDAGSIYCTDGAVVRVTYDRMFLDEDPGEPGTLTISEPGVPTAPFFDITNVPCIAGTRPRTTDTSAYYGGFGQVYGGRTTVLAYAQGEETYQDSNGNGIYDFGEQFTDLTEAFLDHNEDGVYGDPLNAGASTFASPKCYGPSNPLSAGNPAELDQCYQAGGDEDDFIDFNNDGVFNLANGIYNGTSCPKEISDRTDTCDNAADPCDEATEQYCTRSLVSIRKSLPLLSAGTDVYAGLRSFGGSFYSLGEYTSAVSFSGEPANGYESRSSSVVRNDGVVLPAGTDFFVGFADSHVPPGIGETVSLVAAGFSVQFDVSDRWSGRLPQNTTINVDSAVCDIENEPSGAINNSSGLGFTQRIIQLGALDAAVGSGNVTIGVTTPNGALRSFSFTCFAD